MPVYVDEAMWAWHGLRWCHLLADDVGELHRFAAALGIKRTSYQGPPRTGTPHYDLTAYERRMAIARGAVVCNREDIVAVLRRIRPARKGCVAAGGRASSHTETANSSRL